MQRARGALCAEGGGGLARSRGRGDGLCCTAGQLGAALGAERGCATDAWGMEAPGQDPWSSRLARPPPAPAMLTAGLRRAAGLRSRALEHGRRRPRCSAGGVRAAFGASRAPSLCLSFLITEAEKSTSGSGENSVTRKVLTAAPGIQQARRGCSLSLLLCRKKISIAQWLNAWPDRSDSLFLSLLWCFHIRSPVKGRVAESA